MSTLNDLVASQDALLREAALALPHEFSRCTFTMGHIRQAVYLCLTCATPRGICSSCSIACHTDHEQVELFPKRHFRCDCPTAAIPHACTLHKRTEDQNTANQYGQNFQALFCRCAKPYDPKTEPETMIQCLACEDWFHESCLNLRECPPCESSLDVPDPNTEGTLAHDGDFSDTSSSALPPPLISADDYDSFVCAACVIKVPILRRYAGTKGAIIVVRDGDGGTWKMLEEDPPENIQLSSEGSLSEFLQPVMMKRSRLRSSSPSNHDGPQPKKPKTSQSLSCLAPAVNRVAQAIFSDETCASENSTRNFKGTGDIFLTEGFRQRWCQCDRCLSCLQAHPYLLEEEDTYEPPEDPDSGVSFEELGTRALERLPRDCAIEGIHAFNDMRDHLLEYLRPFAQEGKIVEEADVTRFFEAFKQKRTQVN